MNKEAPLKFFHLTFETVSKSREELLADIDQLRTQVERDTHYLGMLHLSKEGKVVSQCGWLKYNYGERRHKIVTTSSPTYYTPDEFLKRHLGGSNTTCTQSKRQ